MKEITYRQPRRRLMIVIVLAYLAVLITLAVVFSDQASSFVNDLAGGGASMAGLVVGIVCLAPAALVLALVTEKVTVRQDAATLSIRAGRSETSVPRRDIRRIRVNDPRVGSIRLFSSQGEQIVALDPRPQEFTRLVEMLTEDGAYAEVDRRTTFRGRINVVTYERQQRPAPSVR